MLKNIPGALILCILLISCGGGSGSQGTLVISLTDAPAPSFAAIKVTVYAVRVHESADAGENDPGWHQLALVTPAKIDLLRFRNGVLLKLGSLSLPAGDYQQIRLLLAPNSGRLPAFNDSVMPDSGPQAGLELPLEMRHEDLAGIRIIHQFTVSEGQVTDLTLDFDGNSSVIQRGDGTYMLQPVVTATSALFPAAGVGFPGDRGDQPGEMGDYPPALGAGRHECELLEDGEVKCWGDNPSGQLGAATGYPGSQGN